MSEENNRLEIINRHFREAITGACQLRQISWTALAEATGVHPMSVQKLAANPIQVPLCDLVKVSRHLGLCAELAELSNI